MYAYSQSSFHAWGSHFVFGVNNLRTQHGAVDGRQAGAKLHTC